MRWMHTSQQDPKFKNNIDIYFKVCVLARKSGIA